MNSTKKGKIAEEKAIEFLKNKNFKIIKTNYYCKGGEIDIIAYKDNVFHLIEVKSGDNFEPIYNITKAKLKRIIKCAYSFIKKEKINSAFCIDAIIIKNNSIELIKNLTL